jgi:DNA-binding transcriptional MerR regulator
VTLSIKWIVLESISGVKGFEVKISELSRHTGVPVATIKYYLREGLLPPGEHTAPNQARYGDEHVRRLRLVRTLREVGGLRIDAIHAVVVALDDPERSFHAVLGVAHRALAPRDGGNPEPDAARSVDALLDSLGWQVSPDAPGRAELARALTSLRDLGREVDAEVFRRHAATVDALAALEVERVAQADSRTAAVEALVVGTVVFERAMVALRRLAHEHHSARRVDRTPGS